tara:strand:- start:60 stop:206 length:147 start_codon:yes stop_codon:yes gene_type:complete
MIQLNVEFEHIKSSGFVNKKQCFLIKIKLALRVKARKVIILYRFLPLP